MTLGKRLLRSDLAQAVLAVGATFYLHLVYWTTKWTVTRPPATQDMHARNLPFIGCFWHGRMAVMRAAIPPGATIHILISRHRDGALISRAAAGLGVHTVTGSTKSGGAAALLTMQRLLGAGQSVAITPDGPRGPRMRAKLGAIKAAQISGVPILPVSGSVSRRRILDSWDRFCVALPFARGIIVWGEPINVPRDAGDDELDRLRLLLEDQLNALTAEADLHFGQSVVEPAEVRGAGKRFDHAGA